MQSINTTNSLNYDRQSLSRLSAVDKISFSIGKLLTSTILIIVVMLTFLIGVAVHLQVVFDSWFLAIGMQAVILISSTNSDILPVLKLSKTKTLTLIPLIMSMLMIWYLFISFDGLTFTTYSVEWWTAMSKAVGIASTEYMFSYLFTFRYNKFIKDLSELKEIYDESTKQSRRLHAIFNDVQQSTIKTTEDKTAENAPEAPIAKPTVDALSNIESKEVTKKQSIEEQARQFDASTNGKLL
jgi:hypothetical protein